MKKFLEILLQSVIIILLIGVTLTICFYSVNETELAMDCATAFSYVILPMLLLAIGIDIKLERAS